MSLKIALLGYGKMGKEVERTALQHGFEIIVKIDTPEEWAKHYGEVPLADVAIDFSTPDAVLHNIDRCFDLNIPLVVGTTGWYEHLEEVKSRCISEGKSMIYAPNFSIGMNIFFEMNKHLAKLMNHHSEYDVWMEEIHHIHKLDAPSGTAITLANDIISNISRKQKWNNMLSDQSDELGIRSVRQEEVPGIHTVTYESDADTIEIKHTAKGRKGLAQGAIVAAEWIKDKKGFFTMKDLLKQKMTSE